jgi:hypothetical protein
MEIWTMNTTHTALLATVEPRIAAALRSLQFAIQDVNALADALSALPEIDPTESYEADLLNGYACLDRAMASGTWTLEMLESLLDATVPGDLLERFPEDDEDEDAEEEEDTPEPAVMLPRGGYF